MVQITIGALHFVQRSMLMVNGTEWVTHGMGLYHPGNVPSVTISAVTIDINKTINNYLYIYFFIFLMKKSLKGKVYHGKHYFME